MVTSRLLVSSILYTVVLNNGGLNILDDELRDRPRCSSLTGASGGPSSPSVMQSKHAYGNDYLPAGMTKYVPTGTWRILSHLTAPIPCWAIDAVPLEGRAPPRPRRAQPPLPRIVGSQDSLDYTRCRVSITRILLSLSAVYQIEPGLQSPNSGDFHLLTTFPHYSQMMPTSGRKLQL